MNNVLVTFILLLPCAGLTQETAATTDKATTEAPPAADTDASGAMEHPSETAETDTSTPVPAASAAMTTAEEAPPAPAPEPLIVSNPTPVVAPLEPPANPQFAITRAPAAPKSVPLLPGPHFGGGARILTLGALRAKVSGDDEFAHTAMANTAGVDIYFEYMTEGQVVAPGVAFRVDFPIWAEDGVEKYPMGVEMQLDYRMRLYLSKASLLRPYFQGAFGLSLGVANSLVNDAYPLAVGFNGSGSAGIALAPSNSKAVFYFDVGLQGTMFWIPEKNDSSSTSGGYYSYMYYYSNGEGDGTINGAMRYMVISLGVEI